MTPIQKAIEALRLSKEMHVANSGSLPHTFEVINEAIQALQSLQHEAVALRNRFNEQLFHYFGLGVLEGKESRDHDDKEGSAQKALAELNAIFDQALYTTPQPPAVPDSFAELVRFAYSEGQGRPINELSEFRWVDSESKRRLEAMLKAARPAKHSRSTLPDGVNRVRNVATGEITERRAVPDGYVMVQVVNCPNSGCNDSGCIPIQVGEDDWEPQQCEFCYTTPNSAFNLAPVIAAQQGGGQ